MDDKNNNENVDLKNIINNASTFFGSSDSYFDN